MNDTNSNDFSVDDLKLINDTLAERFGKPVETQRADIGLRIYEGDRKTS
ncbi:MAG: hypothetical protein BMS9Abin31_0858 [Gammaproteobacteria bacterium]|nr:MAG: hypothetical protein BMS9Abin31_0858 [Gammaproteobacteria bacterium]